MKKKILLIVGLIFILIGAAISYFAGFELADVTGLAVTMFGAGVAVASFWEKRDTTKKTWLSVLGLVFISIGAFLLGFGGFVEATMTSIITGVFGLAAIIAGIIVTVISSKSSNSVTEETTTAATE